MALRLDKQKYEVEMRKQSPLQKPRKVILWLSKSISFKWAFFFFFHHSTKLSWTWQQITLDCCLIMGITNYNILLFDHGDSHSLFWQDATPSSRIRELTTRLASQPGGIMVAALAFCVLPRLCVACRVSVCMRASPDLYPSKAAPQPRILQVWSLTAERVIYILREIS